MNINLELVGSSIFEVSGYEWNDNFGNKDLRSYEMLMIGIKNTT